MAIDVISTVIYTATAMTRQKYCDYRKWTLPINENGSDKGYRLISENHQTWVDENVYKANYKVILFKRKKD